MKPLIIGIGELYWEVLQSDSCIGGASANFGWDASTPGADSQIVRRVGNGESRGKLLANLALLGQPVDGISIDSAHAAGSVDVEFIADGQRVCTILKDVAPDHLISNSFLKNLFARADVVCFGTLDQRTPNSAEVICDLIALTSPETLRVFDVNLRQDYFSADTVKASLKVANVVKLNGAELPAFAAPSNSFLPSC